MTGPRFRFVATTNRREASCSWATLSSNTGVSAIGAATVAISPHASVRHQGHVGITRKPMPATGSG